MKTYWIAIAVVVLLLVGGYQYVPNLTESIADTVERQINLVAAKEEMPGRERHDSLLVVSLNLRNEGENDLAMRALLKADSVNPGVALTQGLLGMYYLERERPAEVMAAWRRGAAQDTSDSNLRYLQNLDTAALEYIDINMLESMFVDRIINARLEQGLYHPYEESILKVTERKIRLLGAVDSSFYLAVAMVLLLIIIRQLWKLFHHDSKEDAGHKLMALNLAVGRTMIISGIVRAGYMIATLFNLFMIGSDIRDFVSGYVLEPENLAELFETDILFVVVFGIMLVVQFFRRGK